MRNLALIFTALLFGATNASAVTLDNKVAPRNAYGYNNSFIFVENGITFSVYPDGEFDFYIDQRNNINANVNFGNANITFNSGYNYDPYVQYDDYGAVIQVENVPVYYDHYGRVAQIGGVDVNYYNGRVSRLGGLYVYYNNRGLYSYHRGFINHYNRYYVYSPFHAYFARPALGFSLVFGSPYRRYYTPVRYTYYSPYHHNYRKAYARIGHEHRYYGHQYDKRNSVYRNDNRVAVNNSRRTEAIRSNNSFIGSNATSRSLNTGHRNTVSNRSSEEIRSNNGVNRTNAIARSTSPTNRNTGVNRSEVAKRNAVSSRSFDRKEAPKREVSNVSGSTTNNVTRSTGNTQTRTVASRNDTNKQFNRATVNNGSSRSNANYVKSENKSNTAPQRSATMRSGSNKSTNTPKVATRSSVSKAVSRATSVDTRSSASNGRSSSARSNVRSQK